MSYEDVRLEREGTVARVTIDRPDRLNAMTTRTSDELVEAFSTLGEDPQIRCIVITGEGRGFCAGQDLTEFRSEYENGRERDIEGHLRATYNRLVLQIAETPKPVIAEINGVAAGAGLSLALACDLRVAGDGARFTLAFVKIGLIPDSGATWLLPRTVGLARALELAITGDVIDAERALEIGLVHRVVPADTLRDQVDSVAKKFAELPTRAIAETRRLFLSGQDGSLAEAVDREALAQGEMGRTHDHLEGVSAFLAKREPKFEGR
ncbi:MAG: enoyl-CoA hydratase/isomerase family protein [Actinomycetota bacterium]